jgi:hypothetical protein
MILHQKLSKNAPGAGQEEIPAAISIYGAARKLASRMTQACLVKPRKPVASGLKFGSERAAAPRRD